MRDLRTTRRNGARRFSSLNLFLSAQSMRPDGWRCRCCAVDAGAVDDGDVGDDGGKVGAVIAGVLRHSAEGQVDDPGSAVMMMMGPPVSCPLVSDRSVSHVRGAHDGGAAARAHLGALAAHASLDFCHIRDEFATEPQRVGLAGLLLLRRALRGCRHRQRADKREHRAWERRRRDSTGPGVCHR